jgi:hypothetical protein
MQPPDRISEKRRRGQDINLVARRPSSEPEGRHGVGNDESFDSRIGKNLGGASHKKAMGNERDRSARPCLPGRPRGAKERASGTDQIVDDKRGRSRHIADEEIARDDAGAAMLVSECLTDRATERSFQSLAK